MRKLTLLAILFLFIACSKKETEEPILIVPDYIGTGSYQGNYFPTADWRSCSPEEVGLSTDLLTPVHDFITYERTNTNGLLIVKDGYVVYEEYFNNHTPYSLHPSYSVAKSFTSGAIGLAIDKGFINSIHDSITDYFPQIQTSETQAEKKEITIKHLLNMGAGFEWNEDDYTDLANNDIFRMMNESDDFIDYVLSKPVINKPGTVCYYSSGESMLLSGIVQNATGQSMFHFMNEHLFQHIGIRNLIWDADPSGTTIGGWGVNTSLREYAKYGYLFLNEGNWDGTEVLSKSWVNESVDAANGMVSNYIYQWWLANSSSFQAAQIPEDTYLAVGLYRQYLIIIPSENIIIVRMGNDAPNASYKWSTAELISLVLEAITE